MTKHSYTRSEVLRVRASCLNVSKRLYILAEKMRKVDMASGADNITAMAASLSYYYADRAKQLADRTVCTTCNGDPYDSVSKTCCPTCGGTGAMPTTRKKK